MPKKTSNKTLKLFKQKQLVALGVSSVLHGVASAAKNSMVSYQRARYWRRKLLDPTFHPKKNGGIKKPLKFSPQEKLVMEAMMWAILKRTSQLTIPQLVLMLQNAGFAQVNYWDVRDTFRRWRWTYKVPSHIQLQKYSVHNCRYYAQYLVALQSIDLRKLKFLDEAHFVSRELFARKAWAPVGKRCFVFNRGNLSASFSMTIMTSLAEPADPLFISLRANSNTQYDFLQYIVSAITHNKLQQGDILVLDNATVHGGLATFQLLSNLLTAAGVRLVYLPTYSPELNPVELCWNVIKKHLTQHRDTTIPFWLEIVKATAQINIFHLLKFYAKCTAFPNVENH